MWSPAENNQWNNLILSWAQNAFTQSPYLTLVHVTFHLGPCDLWSIGHMPNVSESSIEPDLHVYSWVASHQLILHPSSRFASLQYPNYDHCTPRRYPRESRRTDRKWCIRAIGTSTCSIMQTVQSIQVFKFRALIIINDADGKCCTETDQVCQNVTTLHDCFQWNPLNGY